MRGREVGDQQLPSPGELVSHGKSHENAVNSGARTRARHQERTSGARIPRVIGVGKTLECLPAPEPRGTHFILGTRFSVFGLSASEIKCEEQLTIELGDENRGEFKPGI